MKVLSVVGNRPQFIKSGPVSEALRARGIDEVTLHTGQHYDRELSQVFFEELDLPEPRYRLEVGGLERAEMLGAVRPGLLAAITKEAPDWVLVYGDTNSTLGGARAAVEAGVPLAHVEAGLRSYDDSMPEEHNRVETDRLSQLLFAPDDRSKAILDGEEVPGHVEVVGDVMLDAHQRLLPIAWERSRILERLGLEPGGYVVATLHREANVAEPRLGRIMHGLQRLDEPVVFPAHPRTRAALEGQTPEGFVPNVRLIEPLGYLDFAALASRARVIVTDSGGLQKEAYWNGVPCVTARPSTEWVDTVEAGANVLVDDDPDRLAEAVRTAEMPAARLELYGDGHAARRIAAALYPFPADMSTYDIAVIGAGYVGMPHAQTFAEAGKKVVIVDVVQDVVDAINRGESHILDVPSEKLAPLVESGAIAATTDFAPCADAAAIVIAVPTPLSPQREPDVSFIESAATSIAPHLRKGQLVVLESTTYPGTTKDVLQPILERGSGLTAGTDFHLAYAPERVDPGREDFTTKTTPKVVGGIDEASASAAAELYSSAVDNVHIVSSPEAAELTKLLENIFRSVNIALVNELAQLCDRMGIDVWEVVDAAATKPFGFMSFKPGPGLGGHCIPLDPYYLSWKAREFDFNTRFVELAGEINNNMPYFCRSVISQALNHGAGKALSESKILVLGVAYKSDIDDVRESPAEKIVQLLKTAGSDVAYHDPHVPEFDGMTSVPLEPEAYDCVVIVTAHSSIDHADVVRRGKVIVDFRNATKGAEVDGKVWKL